MANRGANYGDLQSRTLVVRGLAQGITKDLLKELFMQGGPVRNVVMPQNSFAFVEFDDAESVGYCLALFNGVEINGKPLECKPKLEYNEEYYTYQRRLQQWERNPATLQIDWLSLGMMPDSITKAAPSLGVPASNPMGGNYNTKESRDNEHGRYRPNYSDRNPRYHDEGVRPPDLRHHVNPPHDIPSARGHPSNYMYPGHHNSMPDVYRPQPQPYPPYERRNGGDLSQSSPHYGHDPHRSRHSDGGMQGGYPPPYSRREGPYNSHNIRRNHSYNEADFQNRHQSRRSPNRDNVWRSDRGFNRHPHHRHH